MNHFKSLLFLLLCTLSLHAEDMVQGYVTYYGSDPTLEQVDAMTHMAICFVAPDGVEGDIQFPWDHERLYNLIGGAKRLGTKTLLTFGGGNIILPPELMGDEVPRQRMVSKLMDLMEKYDFDGFDNDWEPDFGGDAEALVNNRCMRNSLNDFHKELRDSMDARFGSGSKTLSMAVVQDPMFHMDGVTESIYPRDIADHVDFLCVMSYTTKVGKDFGEVDQMFGEKGSMTFWETWAPAEKLIAGLPFFGQAGWQIGLVCYKEIMAMLPTDDSLTSHVTADFGEGEMTYGFCNLQNIKEKQRLAKERNYGGVFFWELDGDLPLDNQLSLLRGLTDYEVSDKKVTQIAPIESRTHTPVFSDTLLLSDYFSVAGSKLTCRLERQLKRFSATISGDTLIITGDGVEMNTFTQVTIRVEDANNLFDYQIHDYFITVEVDNPVEASASENLVKSADWDAFASIGQPMVPRDAAALRTTTPEGDTVINFASSIVDTNAWNFVGLGVAEDSLCDLTDKRIIIEYQSDLTVNMDAMAFTILDENSNYHYYLMRVSPGEWLKDTLTIKSFKKGWEQPETLDYTKIDTMLISIGGSKRSESYCFMLRDYRIEKNPIALLQTKQMVGHHCNLSAFSSESLRLHYRVNEPHQFTLYDMKGRELKRAMLSPKLQQLTLDCSLAKGAYIAKIEGANLQKVWRVALQ